MNDCQEGIVQSKLKRKQAMNKCNLAVVGATGAVGECLLSILAEREFPVENLYALASERSAGSSVMFGNKQLRVENLADFDFSNIEIGLFSAGGSISAEYVPKAVDAGCVVIDNTSCFRYDDDIPLVVTEVNPQCLADYRNRNIIANPNCSTMQMVVALKPIQDAAGIRRISVATYQAVSGAGRAAVAELARQTAELLNGRPAEADVFPSQIAFNALPHIDKFMDNGYTREEMKMNWETRKILGDDSIRVSATCVRIPVFYGHSEAVQIETEQPISAREVSKLLSQAPGVSVIDDPELNDYPTPVEHATGTDPVFVGRIREDISLENGISLWIVADNIRKGAALNTVQIAELLLAEHLS